MKIKILILSFLILNSAVFASDERLLKDNFLKSSLGLSEVPMHSYIILKDDIEDGVEKILKDTYNLPVIKYWKSGNKVGFILEAIGKHEFITTGFMVEDNKISDAKVLVYRENYGYEIKYDMFINQIKGNSMKDSKKLVKRIANISGATLSVNSMRKLSKLSLYLYSKI